VIIKKTMNLKLFFNKRINQHYILQITDLFSIAKKGKRTLKNRY